MSLPSGDSGDGEFDELPAHAEGVLGVLFDLGHALLLLCQLKRRFVPTTDSAHAFGRYPNLIRDLEIDGLDQVWIADITYVGLPASFCYLAAILEAYSRYSVGWHLGRWIDTRLTLLALEMALASHRAAPGLIHHSDQGVQYASSEYVARLQEAGVLIRMAAV